MFDLINLDAQELSFGTASLLQMAASMNAMEADGTTEGRSLSITSRLEAGSLR